MNKFIFNVIVERDGLLFGSVRKLRMIRETRKVREDIDLEYFRKLLLDRRNAITAGLEARQKDAKPVELDQTRVGRLSRMDAMQQQAMSQAGIRRTELELQRISAALDRLDSGGYGYCLKCGEEIAEGRLRADPTTLVCISCAEKAEKR